MHLSNILSRLLYLNAEIWFLSSTFTPIKLTTGNWFISRFSFQYIFSLMSNVLNLISTCKTCSYKVGCDLPGKYRVALDSDALMFGGHGRVSNVNDVSVLQLICPISGAIKVASDNLICIVDCAASQVGHHLKEYQEFPRQTTAIALTHSGSCSHPILVWVMPILLGFSNN